MGKFQYVTTPYEHQREALRVSSGKEYWALFMEQGTGKTKVTIDTARFLHMGGHIDGVVVVTKNGVHTNWANEEIPKHCEPEIAHILEWDQSKSRSKTFGKKKKALLESNRLAFLCINIESILSPPTNSFLRTFLDKRRCLLVVDESTLIKTPGSKRTRRLRTLSRYAPFRRILSGLPDPEGPFDLYSQLAFLSPSLVGTRFSNFKHRYGQLVQVRYGRGPMFEKVVGYQNLDELKNIVDRVSFRVRLEDCVDLPERTFVKRYFELSKNQSRMYYEMLEESRTTFHPDGSPPEVETPWAMVRDLRLQQIASGYLPVDDSSGFPEPREIISGGNPRLETLMEIFKEGDRKIIVWCRYRYDVDLIMDELRSEDIGAVRYDGTTSNSEKEEAKNRFQSDPKVRAFVSNPMAGAWGLTLHSAHVVVFYTNHWSLELRSQAERRAYRIGLRHPVLYIDLVAKDTIDERIINALREKDDLARSLKGDPKVEWI